MFHPNLGHLQMGCNYIYIYIYMCVCECVFVGISAQYIAACENSIYCTGLLPETPFWSHATAETPFWSHAGAETPLWQQWRLHSLQKAEARSGAGAKEGGEIATRTWSGKSIEDIKLKKRKKRRRKKKNKKHDERKRRWQQTSKEASKQASQQARFKK